MTTSPLPVTSSTGVKVRGNVCRSRYGPPWYSYCRTVMITVRCFCGEFSVDAAPTIVYVPSKSAFGPPVTSGGTGYSVAPSPDTPGVPSCTSGENASGASGPGRCSSRLLNFSWLVERVMVIRPGCPYAPVMAAPEDAAPPPAPPGAAPCKGGVSAVTDPVPPANPPAGAMPPADRVPAPPPAAAAAVRRAAAGGELQRDAQHRPAG